MFEKLTAIKEYFNRSHLYEKSIWKIFDEDYDYATP